MRFTLAVFLVASATPFVASSASHGAKPPSFGHDLIKRAAASCKKTADCSNSVPANANRYCAKGVCSYRCKSGYTASGSACVSAVATTTTSAAAPTKTCAASADCVKESRPANSNAYCKEGNCSWRCRSGFTRSGSNSRPATATAPAATPVLRKTYTGTDFTAGKEFEFSTNDDPTHGLVEYVDASTAATQGLARVTSSGAAILAIDSTSTLGYNVKRPSVRIESKATYDSGTLMIFDLAHMPWGCATWPAMWTYNQPWPAMGEIDIVEGVSNRRFNQHTLHTVPGCTRNPSIPQTGLQNASWVGNDCQAWSWSYGCNVIDWDPASYGEGFNRAGGGVFALLFAETGISIYRWKRSDVPADIQNGAPRWKSWGLPVAAFDRSTCDTRSFFKQQRITFDITTCGDMAGQDHVWQDPVQTGEGCYPKYGNCIAAVQDPENFKEAYFQINYIKVYDI
ncbi:hypothetical protein JCM11251_005520 [Rhodosporidiobolus azoricus]